MSTTDEQRQAAERFTLPSFIREPIEEAIEAAVHPKGMSVHDGKIRGLASDKVAYLLKAYDLLVAQIAALSAAPSTEQKNAKRYEWLRKRAEWDNEGGFGRWEIWIQERHGIDKEALDAAIDAHLSKEQS